MHKATWVSPNHTTENQIDHLCISRKFRRTLQDLRVMRGADASPDHHLLVGTLQLKVKQSVRPMVVRVKDINLLNDPCIAQQFFHENQEEKPSPLRYEGPWRPNRRELRKLKTVWTNTSEEVLGRKKQQNKACISNHSISKISQKRSKKENLNKARTRLQKERAHAEYTEANRDVT